jgi:NADH:ubiquinone oxidoreductase subunit F (NADH-binding)
MTITASAPTRSAEFPAWWIGEPRLMAGLGSTWRLARADHASVHGVMTLLAREELEHLSDVMRLLGRGGAGFPVARKLRSLPKSGVRAVIVNGAESEPASGKDRLLLRRTPHLVLDGLALVTHAVRARTAIVAVHDGEAEASLRDAIAERRDGIKIRVIATPGRFVSGEARAVIRGAEGKAALPPGRRVIPTEHGLFGGPTFLSNAETFAQLAVVARMGSRYADSGIASEPGTTLLTVGGAVARPGVVEVPIGTPLPLLLRAAGSRPGSKVLLGGYHGTFASDPHDLLLSRSDLAARGQTLGAGVVLALSPETCALAEVEAVAAYLARESAGQCGPCVFGLPAIARDLRRLRHGAPMAMADLQRHLGAVAGRGACAHPDGAARFVASALAAFPDEMRAHTIAGTCGRPFRSELPLPSSPINGDRR